MIKGSNSYLEPNFAIKSIYYELHFTHKKETKKIIDGEGGISPPSTTPRSFRIK